ncbi:chromosome segregation protein SMC [Thermoflavimicrobium dichotomicum]|uniref:Chromosome partition protein Smc n=1 Tax=Thermoflavimicrobium dichotomicum TaxID=46223 RepID=A0A1I3UBE0_9BACL|nr:chromosome segregation protein SMC [Thermoflavimicrobium dichotomicum]SFJ80033.1 condensin subunit Smc [Thermoflavimicrobium dichotomicum]
MYLKRLEMIGFKSFADRTELEFVPGITAVVGPNGSGKSNVTDGIRWVLGEQSAKSLRGSKMEDVIFAGSDTRKPVGYCEVSITFDNTERKLPVDYTEVTVTRRVYRSGESEYLLNKKPCRLKDITELFMDTGIGKEAYSMIGQGRIDDILSTKSEDRRAIFEEAAGIVKYKTRKKEAEKKLENTEQNLARIHDLIHELDGQVGPLTEQAEKAKQYKELKKELEQIEVGLYVHKIETLHEKWQQATQEVKQLTQEQLVLSTEVSKKEAQLEELKYQLGELDRYFEQVQAELLQVSEELEKAEGQREVWLERGRSRENARKQLRERIQALEMEMNRLKEEKEKVDQRLAEKKQELREAEAKCLEAQEKMALFAEDEAEQLEVWNGQLQQQRNQLVALNSEKRYVIEQMEQLEEQVKKYQEQKESYESQIASGQAQLVEVEKQIGQIEGLLKQAVEQTRLLVEERNHLERQEKSLLQENRKFEQRYNRLRSQLDVVKEMEAEHTGFFQGVKEILKARDRGVGSLRGVQGAVAQLIQVPEKYEAAIETALGGALQHLVVENEQTGRQGIAYLKEKRLGRATFLPLDVIQGRTLSNQDVQRLQNLSGFVGIASDLVQTDAKYEKLVSHLLGLVVVAETLEQANQIARQLQYRYRVVTLDGDVVNPGGSMTGGSRQQSKTNLLGRSRQIEELEQQIAQLKQEWNQVEESLAQLYEQKQKLERDWEEIRTQGEERRLKEQELRGQKRELGNHVERIKKELALLKQTSMQSEEKREKLKHRYQEIEEQAQSLEQAIRQLEEQMAACQLRVKEQATAKADVHEQLTEWRVTVAKLRQETANLAENLERMEQEWNRLRQQKEEAQAELEQLDQQKETGTQELEELAVHIEQLREKKLTTQEKVAKAREQREKLRREREEQEQEIRADQQTLRKLSEQLKSGEVRVNRLDVELNHLLQKLAEEYEMTYERAKELYARPEEPNKAERQVRSIKQQITALGEVNLGAIEEHQRLTERLSFLKSQEADLLQAKQTLYEVIGQIEEEMGKRFAEAFAMIRTEFQEVFVQMFGGGRADLHLTEPDNLLETGIEIVAQPPGKKLQNLTLLSGGERALAAIALLFAVLRIKPVPFCVLDEVDAALDEANLTRFTRYMRKFANQTQFIVITHRKHTMEGADVLYGITMQESGVSKLVSVKLEEYDVEREVAATHE